MTENKNPFLEIYDTPHQTVPFHLIRAEHYEPAIRKGIEDHDREIDAITSNPEPPTFANTILALEKTGTLLDRAFVVFSNMLSAESNDEMHAIAERVMPALSEHSNNITLNGKLFERIKTVYDNTNLDTLGTEERMLLTNTYEGFLRKGANLDEKHKERLRQIASSMSLLTLRFSQNNRKETNAYEMPLTNEQLEGLPENIVEAYAQTAKEKGKEGHIVTLDAPAFMPFMKYSTHRELRQKLYMAYNTRGINDNEYNNLNIVKELVNLCTERAQLLGYNTAADYVLTKRMAENSDNVYHLLDQLLEAYTPTAQREVQEVEALAKESEGEDFRLMPWDWAYYSEKLKQRKFSLDGEALRPYFELSRVIDGVFGLATRLYGITFT